MTLDTALTVYLVFTGIAALMSAGQYLMQPGDRVLWARCFFLSPLWPVALVVGVCVILYDMLMDALP